MNIEELTTLMESETIKALGQCYETATLYEFDGKNEFVSDLVNRSYPDIAQTINSYGYSTFKRIIDYKCYKNPMSTKISGDSLVFETALVSFDNSARYSNRAIILNSVSPHLYKEHLSQIINYTKENHKTADKYMFIHTWNEWAEGAHLEPDRRYGYAWLKATRDAILESRTMPLSGSVSCE